MRRRAVDFTIAIACGLPGVACAPTREVDFEPHHGAFATCADRGNTVSDGSSVAFAATLHRIRDDTAVDGDVSLILIRGDGSPIKATFGSLFTRPSPTAERRATYESIRLSREGDCVQITGTQTTNGEIWITRFADLDRS